jgi:hypothetical protein
MAATGIVGSGEPVMRIDFQQSGGVAAIARPPVVIDTAGMDRQQAQKWHDLVAAADFFNLPPTFPPGPGGDAFSYRITVGQDGRRHTIHTRRGVGPAALDALIEHLRQAGLATTNQGPSPIH